MKKKKEFIFVLYACMYVCVYLLQVELFCDVCVHAKSARLVGEGGGRVGGETGRVCVCVFFKYKAKDAKNK